MGSGLEEFSDCEISNFGFHEFGVVMAIVLNTLGLVSCLGGIGLLVFRNRLVTRELDLAKREACLERYFMGRYWLDLGIGSLVVGFLLQIIAAFL